MSSKHTSTSVWLIGATTTVVLVVSLTILWKLQQPTDDDGPDIDWSDDEFDLPPHIKRNMEKEKRRQEKIPLLAMKKPMYDNIRMLDPDGTLLCTISKKKARWYINKDLAVWEDGDQESTIQLLFEPSHRSNQSSSDDAEDDKFFNKSMKENICVVCGHDIYHMRHYVVPYSCRSLFPKKYKMHMAHDVVILCPDCHLVCKKLATKRMKQLEAKCRTDPNTGIPHFVDREKYQVKSWALALLRRREKLPSDVREKYEAHIRQYAKLKEDEELTEEILQNATEVETEIPNPDYIPTAEIVVQSFCQDDDAIEKFVKDWRQYFVDTMEPQYLPTGWDVDSSVQCQSAERKHTRTDQS